MRTVKMTSQNSLYTCFQLRVSWAVTSVDGQVWSKHLKLSAAFYADTIRRINRLTLAFAQHFQAFERLHSTRSPASFLRNVVYALLRLFSTTIAQVMPTLCRNGAAPVTPRHRVKRYTAEIAALRSLKIPNFTVKNCHETRWGFSRFNISSSFFSLPFLP